MGGKSTSEQTTNQTSKTDPYGPSKGLLDNLLGQAGKTSTSLTGAETGALDSLQTNINAGNPYAPQIGMLAGDLLSGGPDRTGIASNAYADYSKNIGATASGAYTDPNTNPGFRGLLDTISNDVSGRVNSMFAAGGRDFSGAHAGTLARGITEGTAPVIANQYNVERDRQLGAADRLFGAGGTTAGILSGLDQARFGNRTAGVDMAGNALEAKNYTGNQTLEVEAARRGIPMQTISGLLGTIAPVAGAFGTNTGTSRQEGSQEMSGAQQAWGWMNATGNLAKGLFGGGGGGVPFAIG